MLSGWFVGAVVGVLIYAGMCLVAGLVGAVIGLLLPGIFSKPGKWITAFFSDDDTSSWGRGT